MYESENNKMKILVYTTITNNHDDLKDMPIYENESDITRIAYLDKPTLEKNANKNFTQSKIGDWEIKSIYNRFSDYKRNGQIYKILSHIYGYGYDYTIWVDGSVIIQESIGRILDKFSDLNCDIALHRHSERDCIYQESKDCIYFKLDDKNIIQSQMNFYKSIAFPKHFGLSETPFIIRKNNKSVMEFNNFWWAIICSYSKRDQLSFDFVRWMLPHIKIGYFDGTVHINQFFGIQKHKVLREHEK